MNQTIHNLIGVVSPAAASIAVHDPKNPHIGASLIPGVALGVCGYVIGSKLGHPVLGFLGAEAVGLNAVRFARNNPGDRTIAVTNVVASLASIGVSLAMPKRPFAGWWLGLALGAVVTSFVKGSNAAKLKESLFA